MQKNIDLADSLLKTWETTNEVSLFLISNIPVDLWNRSIPGYRRKTIRTLAIHLHNVRCTWIKSIAKTNFSKKPQRITLNQATRKEVIAALKQSNEAMLSLLIDCIDNGGRLPSKPAWLNFPNDVVHLLAYFIAHEAHHRGQIIMAARQLDRPLTRNVTGGLWQWRKRLKEAGRP
jgi:uncharacterized damage-inducible protein DinB